MLTPQYESQRAGHLHRWRAWGYPLIKAGDEPGLQKAVEYILGAILSNRPMNRCSKAKFKNVKITTVSEAVHIQRTAYRCCPASRSAAA